MVLLQASQIIEVNINENVDPKDNGVAINFETIRAQENICMDDYAKDVLKIEESNVEWKLILYFTNEDF